MSVMLDLGNKKERLNEILYFSGVWGREGASSLWNRRFTKQAVIFIIKSMFYAHYLIVKKARLMRSQLLMGTKKNYLQIYSSLKRSSRKLSSFCVKIYGLVIICVDRRGGGQGENLKSWWYFLNTRGAAFFVQKRVSCFISNSLLDRGSECHNGNSVSIVVNLKAQSDPPPPPSKCVWGQWKLFNNFSKQLNLIL